MEFMERANIMGILINYIYNFVWRKYSGYNVRYSVGRRTRKCVKDYLFLALTY